MIRIEDTDQARSSDESARGILEDLAWLGIGWDDGPVLGEFGAHSRPVGPYFQARRVEIYNAYIADLVQRGRAYAAFESAAELDAIRKEAVAAKRTYRYARPADVVPGVFNEARWSRALAGEAHVVRFVAPDEEIVVHDQILGDVRIAPGELDDLVIRKADGLPTYHFAVVIDDELMGVTHVLRAQEHLANTPRHVAMQKALLRLDGSNGSESRSTAFRTPVYGHMPLICNMDGSKMSKRDKAKAARKGAKDAIAKDAGLTPASIASATGLEAGVVAGFLAGEHDRVDVAEALARHFRVALPEIEVWDFRRNGYLPEAITNFIALLGWNPGMKLADGKDLEKFDNAFLAKHFSMERIGKTSAKFDRAKLLSFNQDAIGAMTDEQFADRWLAWLAEYEPAARARLCPDDSPAGRQRVLTLAKAVKPRARTLRDAIAAVGFVLVPDDGVVFDDKAVAKNLRGGDPSGLSLLAEFRTVLAGLSPFDPAGVQSAVERFAEGKGFPNPGPIAQALRVAVTGTGVSPGLGETLGVLGQTSTLVRIDRCLSLYP